MSVYSYHYHKGNLYYSQYNIIVSSSTHKDYHKRNVLNPLTSFQKLCSVTTCTVHASPNLQINVSHAMIMLPLLGTFRLKELRVFTSI